MAQTYIDGDYSRASAVGAPRFVYPFRNNGDRVSAYFTQEYWQTKATWTPQEFGISHETLRDFYLIAESDPEEFMMAGLVRFARTYARVPATQVYYSSRNQPKPAFPATDYEDYYLTTIEPAELARIYGLSQSLSGEAWKVIGGTYILTINGSATTFIAWNASAATVKAAIEGALPGYTAAVTQDVASQKFTFSIDLVGVPQNITSISIDVTSLTPITGGTVLSSATTVLSNATFAYRSSTNQFTSTAHGLVAADVVLPFTGSTPGADATIVTVPDANTLTFAIAGVVASTTGSGYNAFRRFIREYVPGSTQLLARVTERYYLPGVTPGIATPADIPITSPNVSDGDLLNAVLTDTGFQPVEFTGPERWLDSPIYRTTTTEVNFDDL